MDWDVKKSRLKEAGALYDGRPNRVQEGDSSSFKTQSCAQPSIIPRRWKLNFVVCSQDQHKVGEGFQVVSI